MIKWFIHSFEAPLVLKDESGTYTNVDGRRLDLPSGVTNGNFVWFRKPYKGGKNPAFHVELDWEVEGSGGKKYKVSMNHKEWTCNCHAFKFSGLKRSCKHTEQVKASYLS
jgi:hypothetical protein